MHEAVEDGGGHGGVLEVPTPIGDNTVRSDEDGAARLVTAMHDGPERLGRSLGDATGQEQIVQNQEIRWWPRPA